MITLRDSRVNTKKLIKNIAFFIVLTLFVLLSAYQARYTGELPFKIGLPYDLSIKYMGMDRWVLNQDGDGVISPNSVHLSDETIKIRSVFITKYAFNSNSIYVWFDTVNEGSYCSFINDRSFERIKQLAYPSSSDVCTIESVLKENPTLKFIDFDSLVWPKLFGATVFLYLIFIMYTVYTIINLVLTRNKP